MGIYLFGRILSVQIFVYVVTSSSKKEAVVECSQYTFSFAFGSLLMREVCVF